MQHLTVNKQSVYLNLLAVLKGGHDCKSTAQEACQALHLETPVQRRMAGLPVKAVLHHQNQCRSRPCSGKVKLQVLLVQERLVTGIRLRPSSWSKKGLIHIDYG